MDEIRAIHAGREVEVRHEGDGRGEWDPDRVEQVVQNLLTNAIKYSPEGSPVEIETRAEDGSVSISVHNQGAPIPPDPPARACTALVVWACTSSFSILRQLLLLQSRRAQDTSFQSPAGHQLPALALLIVPLLEQLLQPLLQPLQAEPPFQRLLVFSQPQEGQVSFVQLWLLEFLRL